MKELARAIKRAVAQDDWRTRPSPYCMSCSFQSQCPAWAESRVGDLEN
jgi:CRISPR/Cas system-associated exonuclease Cas4 (RecB family)